MRRLVAFPILASLLALVAVRAEAVTYTWVGGVGASWTTSTSWSPPRTTPAITDRMVFDSGTSVTVLNVPNTNIAQIAVINGTQVVFRAGGSNFVVTLNGDAGTDLVVGPGAMLSLESANILNIQLATGTTGQVDGLFRASTAGHRLLAVDTGAIVFTSGSSALAHSGFTGNMFGVGSAFSGPGSVHFQAGSTYIQQAGVSPFGTAVQQVVVFEPGSLYRINAANVNLAAGGRTFANVEYIASGTAQLSGTAPCTMDSLVVKVGTLQLNVSAEMTIRGAVRVDSVASLSVGSTTSVRLAGATTQVVAINAPTPLPFDFNGLNTVSGARLIFDNPNGVRLDLEDALDVAGVLEFEQGVVSCPPPAYVRLRYGTGATTGGSASTGWYNGYMLSDITAANSTITFPFGNEVKFAPYTLTIHGLSDTARVGGAFEDELPPEWFAGDQIDPVKRLVGENYYVTVQRDTNFSSFDATFHFEAPVGADPLQFVSRRRGQFNDMAWRPTTVGTRTATTLQVVGVTRPPGSSHYYFGIGEPSVVNVSVGEASIAEGGGALKTPSLSGSGATLSFPVRLSEPAVETITVDFATAAGSAQAGADFDPQSGTLTFLPGDTVEVVDVPIVGEGDPEPHETLSLVLSNPTGAVLADAEGTGTILDDDDVEPPVVTVTYPNGHETIIENSTIDLQWTATDNVEVDYVKLRISRDNGATWEVIANELPNTGSHSWTVPPGLTQEALFEVGAFDHRGHLTVDLSDAMWTIWGVDDVSPVSPTAFALDLVSQNPSRSGARLRLAMPREQAVHAGVYDVRGRKLTTLVDGVLPAGVHDLAWRGEGAGAGLYFVDVITEGFRARTRITRLP